MVEEILAEKPRKVNSCRPPCRPHPAVFQCRPLPAVDPPVPHASSLRTEKARVQTSAYGSSKADRLKRSRRRIDPRDGDDTCSPSPTRPEYRDRYSIPVSFALAFLPANAPMGQPSMQQMLYLSLYLSCITYSVVRFQRTCTAPHHPPPDRNFTTNESVYPADE
jgi:hypothetical protein